MISAELSAKLACAVFLSSACMGHALEIRFFGHGKKLEGLYFVIDCIA
jgi:hypothetical protein